MKKTIVFIFILGILTVSGCSPGSEDRITLNVYNWGDYMDESLLDEFESQYPIDINYEVFQTNEEMLSKIQAGGSSYDVIFPSEYMIESMISLNLLDEINYTDIPNIDNIIPEFRDLSYDPNGKYSVPYMWGTMGIVYNTKKVQEPIDSWEVLWDPKYKGQIIMIDSPRDTIGITLKKLGYSLNSRNLDELQEAKEELIKQKPLVKSYEVDTYKSQMIAEEAAMSIAWSGDAMLLIDENPDLAYNIPKEGTNLWFDAMAIPTTSKHPNEAAQFINFLLDAKIAAKNAEYIMYSSPNQAAIDLLPEEIRTNPYLYPKGDILDLGEVFTDLGDFTQYYDRAWTEIKSH